MKTAVRLGAILLAVIAVILVLVGRGPAEPEVPAMRFELGDTVRMRLTPPGDTTRPRMTPIDPESIEIRRGGVHFLPEADTAAPPKAARKQPEATLAQTGGPCYAEAARRSTDGN